MSFAQIVLSPEGYPEWSSAPFSELGVAAKQVVSWDEVVTIFPGSSPLLLHLLFPGSMPPSTRETVRIVVLITLAVFSTVIRILNNSLPDFRLSYLLDIA